MAITHGSSRDHRDDLPPWMLALATTHEGDRPLCLQPLSGTTCEKERMVTVMADLQAQWRQKEPDEKPLSVADSGLYSAQPLLTLTHVCMLFAR